MKRLAAWLVVVLASASAVAGEDKWDTVLTRPFLVKTRARPGSVVKEVWAEGTSTRRCRTFSRR